MNRSLLTFLLLLAVLSGCNYSEIIGPDGNALGGNYRAPFKKSLAYQTVVFDFTPAPGQFVNEGYDAATMEEACSYAQGRLASGKFVSLGGFGGYIVVGFDHSIMRTGGYDFGIMSNAYDGNSEPGIVWVMQDENGNGLPDDTWHELKGSESESEGTVHDYEVTYYRPSADNQPVKWTDNQGGSGEIPYMKAYHHQPSYYPEWIGADQYTLKGTMLPGRSYDKYGDGTMWISPDYGTGYADNHNSTDFDMFEFKGNTVPINYFKICSELDYIDFIKVQSGINAVCGKIGEISTEVCGFVDLALAR